MTFGPALSGQCKTHCYGTFVCPRYSKTRPYQGFGGSNPVPPIRSIVRVSWLLGKFGFVEWGLL